MRVKFKKTLLFFSAVSPSDRGRAFGLSPVRPIETPSLKQSNGELRLSPHWRPQSPKSPKSPKVLRLSPQERYTGIYFFSSFPAFEHLQGYDLPLLNSPTFPH